MAGTVAGGKAAAETNKTRYGDNFYNQIGRKGGKISRGGGFALSRELAVEAGRRGGSASRRGRARHIPCEYCDHKFVTEVSRNTHTYKFHALSTSAA